MSTQPSMSSDERPVILDEEANEIGYVAEDGSNIKDFLNRITTPHRGFKYGDKL